MIKYNFFIFDLNETRISVQEPYEMLSDLSNCKLTYVEEIISSIGKVISSEINMFSFGGSDYCILDVYKDKTEVQYDFGESKTFIPTLELLKLLSDWKEYLIEHGK